MERYLRLLLLACALPMFVGCIEMKVEGDAKIFQASDVGVMMWYVVSLGLMGFGAIGVWAGISPHKNEDQGFFSAWLSTKSMNYGLAMVLVGFIMLGIGLFSVRKTHTTVYPDRVAIASSPFSNEETTIPFDNLASVEIVEEPINLRKSKQVIVFTMHKGPPIRKDASGNELHAFDTIRAALAEYQARPAGEKPPIAVADNTSRQPKPDQPAVENPAPIQPTPAPAAEVATTPKQPQQIVKVDITPSGGSGTTPPAPPVDPEPSKPKEYSLKRYPISIPVPEGYSLVQPAAAIEVGTKLSACYSSLWSTVTVVAVNNDGTLTCSWDSYPGSTYKMERQDLVTPEVGSIPEPKPKPDLAAMSRDLLRRGEDLQRKMETAPASPSSGQKEYTLKRYVINIPLPPRCSLVKPGMPIEVGMKLGACYARHWEPVTVVAVNDDDTITCNWDKWKGFTYKMLREDLVIQNKDIKRAKP